MLALGRVDRFATVPFDPADRHRADPCVQVGRLVVDRLLWPSADHQRAQRASQPSVGWVRLWPRRDERLVRAVASGSLPAPRPLRRRTNRRRHPRRRRPMNAAHVEARPAGAADQTALLLHHRRPPSAVVRTVRWVHHRFQRRPQGSRPQTHSHPTVLWGTGRIRR